MDTARKVEELLASGDPEKVREGLDLIKVEIAEVGAENAGHMYGPLTTFFYIDPLDNPELKPMLDEALALVVGCGRCVIPVLLEQLDDSDLKAQIAAANALGRIGADAIDPLMRAYAETDDPGRKAFIVYALGHIRSSQIVRALEVGLDAASSEDRNLRDTGTRAIGRMVEKIPREKVDEELLGRMVEILRRNLGDPNPGIRAKAVRSLGKMAQRGYLEDEMCAWLHRVLFRILGEDEANDWDRAYIVRREAREALAHCPG